MAKVHIAHPEDATRTRCNMPIVSPLWSDGALRLESIDYGHATCIRCCRARDAAAPPAPEPDFVPGPPQPPRYGTRELSRMARKVAERSRLGEAPEGAGWPSAEAAIRAWARGPGSPIRSSSDPGRFGAVQSSRGGTFTPPAHAAIDRHRNTALAWQRAWERLALEPETLARLCPWRVTADWPAPEVVARVVVDARELAWDRILGRANHEQLASDETARWRRIPEVPVTPHQIKILVRYFVGAVEAALVASGEMRARPVREEGPRRWDPARRIREAAR